MHQTIWQTIATTSWWSVVFFIFFCMISYHSTKPKVIHLNTLTTALATIIILATVGIVWFVTLNTHNIILALYTCMLGMGVGWLHFRVVRIKGIPDVPHLHVPGTWIIIFLFLGIMIAKYNGFHFGLDTDLVALLRNSNLLMSFYGFFIGLFSGRWLYGKHVSKHGPFHIKPAH